MALARWVCLVRNTQSPLLEDMHVLLVAGEPLREPVARSRPFVMNTWEEIQQAYSDYQTGKLGEIEGSEERYATTEAARKKQEDGKETYKQQLTYKNIQIIYVHCRYIYNFTMLYYFILHIL